MKIGKIRFSYLKKGFHKIPRKQRLEGFVELGDGAAVGARRVLDHLPAGVLPPLRPGLGEDHPRGALTSPTFAFLPLHRAFFFEGAFSKVGS